MSSRYSLYGATLASTVDLDLPAAPLEASVDVTFELVEGSLVSGGARPVVPIGMAGDLDTASVVLYEEENRDILVLAQAASFEVTDHSIRCTLADSSWRPAVEVWLTGVVMSWWVERTEALALHGAGVILAGRAVGLLGAGGAGKSTLAVSLVRRGHALLADDVVAVRSRSHGWDASPAYPRMRFWPEQAEGLGLPTSGPVLPWVRKQWAGLDTKAGEFAPRPHPLSVLYLVEMTPDASDIQVEDVGQTEALAAVLGHSFLGSLLERSSLRMPRLVRAAALVRGVPVRRLRYSTGLDRLAEVEAALLADVRAFQ